MIKIKKLIIRLIDRDFLLNLYFRRSILIFIDSTLIFTSIKISEYFSSYINKPYSYDVGFKLELIIIFFGLLFNIVTGQYRSITKYISNKALYYFGIRNFIFSCLIYLIFNHIFEQLTLFFCLIYASLITYITLFTRFILRDISISINKVKTRNFQNIVIYGAGSAGVQLAASLKLNNNYKIIYFVDDSEFIWGRCINGIKVNPPINLEKDNLKIDKILFAIPSIDLANKRKIFKFLSNLNKPILQVPSIDEILYKNAKLETFKPIFIEEILGRDPVSPDKEIIRNIITDKTILVTGAAGSIGSELCRQIVKFKPKKLILFDQSEYNLYLLHNEFKIHRNLQCQFILGNVLNKKFLEHIINNNQINIILHAAAYKHVPLLESNIMQGLLNNVLATKNICEYSYKNNIQKVILISSDKAVRPTNIMGASKRISELIVQAYANLSNTEINKNSRVFSMVRFGNVLGSSGSVVPLFRKQILNGGPITLTDPNVTRYFMTIKEASQLVLHSTALSKGGEVFLLDMGQPIKIFDLAKKMIFLSGLTLKDKSNPAGDIEIKNIGLRPGEKLFEELLIDSKSEKTKHPLIYKANEKMIKIDKLNSYLNKLESLSYENDLKQFIDLVKVIVPEYEINL